MHSCGCYGQKGVKLGRMDGWAKSCSVHGQIARPVYHQWVGSGRLLSSRIL